MGKNKKKTLLDKNDMRLKIAKAGHWLVIAVLYLVVFSLLDLLSQRFQIYPGVVAWYPPAGVAFAFLLTFGARFAPVVALGSIISSMIIYKLDAPLQPIVIWAVVLSAAYTANALILRPRMGKNQTMSHLRNTLVWVITSALITAVLALISVTNLITFGAVPQSESFYATFQWWIGEMTGLLVFMPFFLIYVMPWLKSFSEGKKLFPPKQTRKFKLPLEVVGQVLAQLLFLYLIFGVKQLSHFNLHFLVALPLIWVALRHGFNRVSLAVVLTNLGIMFAFWLFDNPVSELGEFQFLLFGVFFSMLLIGAITSSQKASEDEVRKKEELFRGVVENAPDAVLLINRDRTIQYFSPAATRIMGSYSKNQIGENAALFSHPDDAPLLDEKFEEMLKSPAAVFTMQYRARHADGNWRWIESTFTNELENPNINAVVINFRDITDRKEIEDSLLKSERRFRALVEQSSEEISLLDANGILIYESPNTRRPLGYLPDSLNGNSFFELFHPDDIEDAKTLFTQILQHPGMVESARFRVRHQNGSYRWLEGYISNLLDEPAVQSIVLNYSDVTDRVESEQKIEVLARISDESPNPVLRMNGDGMLLYANEQSQKILELWGCSIHEYVPKYMIDIANVALLRNENIPVEINCEEIVFAVTVTPIVETGYVNLYGRDITKRVRAEESLKVRNDELSMLFQLSHSLAEADSLGHIFDIVNRHAVESMHNTFARIALLENEDFVMKAGFPSREINQAFRLSESIPVAKLPFSQRMLKENEIKVINVDDPEIGEEEKEILFINDAKSICLVPLRTSDSTAESETLVGLLMLAESSEKDYEPFADEKLRLVQTIGASAAIAIRRMMLRDQTERRMQQLVALGEIDLAIISNADMRFRLEVVGRQIVQQLNVDAMDFWVYDPNTEQLILTGSRGFKTSAFDSATPVKLDEGMLGQAFLKRQTIHVLNISEHNKNPRLAKALAKEPFMGYYAVPLIANNAVKGVLEIFHRTELDGNPEWMNFLQILANQAAIAIDNSLLFNDLKQSNSELIQAYDATIQGWSRALDLRDNETEGHTQRVTELTMKLARMFGLPEEELIHIRRGALLHDIGKMGVPDRILLKPGPLTDEEWAIMRQHTTFAEKLLSPIAFLKPALDIPMCHHEKWDGSGYPHGLAGDQIPFAARIFSVVDVWDALTSDRPYRAAWPKEKVIEYIQSLSGTQFDPQVVKVCLEPGLLTGTPHQHMAVQQMKWSEEYSVGVHELDLQHQRIIGMINRLISVTGSTSIHSETVNKLIDEMSQYAKIHFGAEERLMESAQFEGLKEHKLQHLWFQARVKEYSVSLKAGTKMTADDFLAFLSSWWQHHILEEDMTCKPFFMDKRFE